MKQSGIFLSKVCTAADMNWLYGKTSELPTIIIAIHSKGVTIYRYIVVSFCRFDISVRLMRIPIYPYTHSSPMFYTRTACLVQLVLCT